MEVLVALWILWLPLGLLKLVVALIELHEKKNNTN